MSLVGTRPPTVDEWEKYELHHRSRMSTKPGITGMWQVSGRSDITDFEEVVRLDTEYIEHWTITTDVKSFTEVKYIFSTWYMPTFNEKEIRDYFPALEAVFYAAGTVKYFAEPFMKSGVKIFSAAKANGVPVAEFTASQIILANKGYFQAQKECKRPFFKFSFNKARQIVYSKTGNYQARVGLIGAGAVGSKVVELLKVLVFWINWTNCTGCMDTV